MARSIRIEYPGAFYHVMARGNRREAIFLDEDDRRGFLKAVSEACGMTGWKVHAWVLMSNHYHFFIETPEANLVAGMKWLQNAYTRRFNTRHRAWGRLFGARRKRNAVAVVGSSRDFEPRGRRYAPRDQPRVASQNPERLTQRRRGAEIVVSTEFRVGPWDSGIVWRESAVVSDQVVSL